jgi:hypothetical protein
MAPPLLKFSHAFPLGNWHARAIPNFKLPKLLELPWESCGQAAGAAAKMRKFFPMYLRRQKSTRTRTRNKGLAREKNPNFS